MVAHDASAPEHYGKSEISRGIDEKLQIKDSFRNISSQDICCTFLNGILDRDRAALTLIARRPNSNGIDLIRVTRLGPRCGPRPDPLVLVFVEPVLRRYVSDIKLSGLLHVQGIDTNERAEV